MTTETQYIKKVLTSKIINRINEIEREASTILDYTDKVDGKLLNDIRRNTNSIKKLITIYTNSLDNSREN